MAFMGLIASQRLSAKPQTFAQTVQRPVPRFRFFAHRTENVIQSGNNESLQSGAMLGRNNFGSMQDFVRQINSRFHEQ
jgi:hypothetical protein